ncbi:NAD(P)/FAD-dependent oxidoreductase [Halomicrobium sp. IBSBa]|uniref:NAD(P)/FAD-dependent oxidoreductase n=1 Tax=Halomicrobium sp. IBSBa TaxID=2778916 RepID=UPI001ABF5B43|nr:NAD(P)/FAD-dependent oxidoreductase [Halomicrobium sp. IBSBa]MBO4248488.1 NAD(P)/FAD-dependent oxidoreductase [Halomicrobium sp. IBSBa]
MESYDIVVAGGGPAGLQFARSVVGRSDHSVAVLEANDELADNDKSTGGTFHQVVEGFGVPDDVVMSESATVQFEGPSARATLDIPNYVLDFPAFLEFLGADAAADGADIHTGVRVREPIVEGGTVVGVRGTRDGESVTYRADLVVDATGPAGTLTTQLDMWDREAAQRGIGKEYEVTGRYDLSSMLFRFDHEYAPGGYAWVFPGGGDVFKVGVCWIDDFYARHSPPDDGAIDDYVERWARNDPRWEVDDVRAVHAGQAISDNSINRRATDGLVAVGDSVSSINPLFGEGIRSGMESAEMAAEVATRALTAGDVSRSFLSAYERRWNREKGSNWKRQRIAGELLYDFDAAQQNRFVANSGRLSDAQLDRLQRYELTLPDLLSLYPFRLDDVRKAPTLLRHLW